LDALLEASATLLSSPAMASVLPRILDLARRVIVADAYALWRTTEGNRWKVVASANLPPAFDTEVITSDPEPQAFTQQPYFIADVFSDPALTGRRELYRQHGIQCLLVLPFGVEGGSRGTISFYFRERRTLSTAELKYATALLNLASSALSTAALYEKQIEEQQRFSYLAELSSVLASSLDYQTTLQQVADMTVPRVADGCNVYMIQGKQLRSVAYSVCDPEKRILAEQLSRELVEELRDDLGAGRLIKNGEPVLFTSVSDEVLSLFSRDPAHMELLRKIGIVSAISVPLFARGNAIGVLRLITAESGRRFTQRDLELARDLGNRAAIAIDNARLHHELERANQLVSLSQDAAGIGTWAWYANAPSDVWLSPQLQRLIDFPPGKISYEVFSEHLHPADRKRVLESIGRAFDEGSTFAVEYRLRRSDGEWRWLESRGKVHRDATGGAVSVYGITMNITARKEAELELRTSEERYRFVTEALPIHVWFGERGDIEYCNQHLLQFTGLSIDELRAGAALKLLHPQDAARVMAASGESFKTGAPFRQEYRARNASGQYRWLLAESRQFIDAQGRIKWLGTSVDITERKHAEEALLRSEKLAATGRLAATIAHEINNPLEAVTNLVYLAQHTPGAPDEVCASLAEADRQLHHVAQIVRHTLGFYRENASARPTGVREMINGVVDLYLRKLAAKKIYLKISVPDDLQFTVVAGEIRQVLANLIANAIDAAPVGGKVQVSGTKAEGAVHIVVSDNGPGIAVEFASQLFQPFFTTKKEVGTGLGLWVSRQIMEKHGGTLSYSRDHVSEETTFTIQIADSTPKD
jgi:PAS domain S-box-containing protein